MRRFVAILMLVAACSYSSIFTPKSEPTAIGTTVTYTVYVGCGLRHSLFDLDHSLWVPIDVSGEDLTKPPSGFDSPDDTGTLSLVASNKAEYRSSHGRRIKLVRHEGNLEIESGCN
jgi:hypothetical protein